jgi:hypothetical protein
MMTMPTNNQSLYPFDFGTVYVRALRKCDINVNETTEHLGEHDEQKLCAYEAVRSNTVRIGVKAKENTSAPSTPMHVHG